MTTAVLEVNDLRLVRPDQAEVLRGVSLTVLEGETRALVGESGSGKSLTALAIMGLLPAGVRRHSGEVHLNGRDTAHFGPDDWSAIRGREVSLVPQDPLTALNPVLTIGAQLTEAMTAHGVARTEAQDRARASLARVGIRGPREAMNSYPHEFSGGMRQRVLIAMATCLHPRLLIADEPTTALDPTVQQQIIDLVESMKDESRMAVLWVTHDLGVVARLAQSVSVMYAGRIVETGSVRDILGAPRHPYSAGLRQSVPSLDAAPGSRLEVIPGRPPDPTDIRGCSFAARCPRSTTLCLQPPPIVEGPGARFAECWHPQEVIDA